jgi:hypothetical protein
MLPVNRVAYYEAAHAWLGIADGMYRHIISDSTDGIN